MPLATRTQCRRAIRQMHLYATSTNHGRTARSSRRRRNAKTFRPKKNTPVGSKGLQLKRHIEATLGSGNLMDAVRLPPGEDLNEWLAVNTVDFYNALSVLYSTLDEFCTCLACEVMTAGCKYEYLWADGVKQKKPVR